MSVTSIASPARAIVQASTVELSGQVVDAESSPLSRIVVAYNANDLTVALGITASDPSTGNFSFTLPGTTATKFACVVQGEFGENCVVHSHKTAD